MLAPYGPHPLLTAPSRAPSIIRPAASLVIISAPERTSPIGGKGAGEIGLGKKSVVGRWYVANNAMLSGVLPPQGGTGDGTVCRREGGMRLMRLTEEITAVRSVCRVREPGEHPRATARQPL
uniref:Uncharacterized protein n=1 Tax=Knipowitschia caucasica TaxID=637954 RepID=A0AAV2JHC0_KNICA